MGALQSQRGSGDTAGMRKAAVRAIHIISDEKPWAGSSDTPERILKQLKRPMNSLSIIATDPWETSVRGSDAGLARSASLPEQYGQYVVTLWSRAPEPACSAEQHHQLRAPWGAQGREPGPTGQASTDTLPWGMALCGAGISLENTHQVCVTSKARRRRNRFLCSPAWGSSCVTGTGGWGWHRLPGGSSGKERTDRQEGLNQFLGPASSPGTDGEDDSPSPAPRSFCVLQRGRGCGVSAQSSAAPCSRHCRGASPT